MRPGQKTSSGIEVVKLAPEFKGFGEAAWGSDPATREDVLLIEVRAPAYIRNSDTNGAPHVLPHLLEDPLTPGTQLVVYRLKGLRQSNACNGAEWIKRAPGDLLRRQRLAKIAQMVVAQEDWRGGREAFFFPYLCPSALLAGPREDVYLLGAPVDFRFESDAFLYNDVKRFVDPSYLKQRTLGGDFVPHEDNNRRHFMRYGAVQMLLEAVLGQPFDRHTDEAVEWESLPAEWQGARPLLERHSNPSALAGEEDGEFLNTFKRLASPPTPFNDSEPVIDSQAPDTSDDPKPRPWAGSGGRVISSEPEPDEEEDPSTIEASDEEPDPDPPIPTSTPTAVSPDPSPPTPQPRRRWPTVVATVGAFLMGLILPVAFLWSFGIDFRHPQELRTLKLQTLLHRWAQEPANRPSLESEIESLSHQNVNLRYMKLTQEMSKASWDADWKELDDALQGGQRPDATTPGGDPQAPMFTADDLKQLRSYHDSLSLTPSAAADPR